jgi:hypothetical protein
MTDDKMKAIEAEVKRKYAIFDARRAKLMAVYNKAQTPKAQLKAVVACMRHHYEYMNSNILLSGWQTQSIANFADVIEQIAEEL